MTDDSPTDLLDPVAGEAPVTTRPASSPNTVRRHGPLVATLAGSAAVVAVAVGSTGLSSSGGGQGAQPPATPPTPVAPAADVRLVGLDHAAIEVPQGWGTNATRCGVPQRDTVVIDVAVVDACYVARRRGVESVEITQGTPRFDFVADKTFSLGDGVEARRQATRCEPGVDDTSICSGTVYVPSARVFFRAESSTGAGEVDRLLATIRIVPDRVGVPGHRTLALDEQGRSGQAYLDVLRDAGFTVTLRTRKVPDVAAGFVLGSSPPPGTMLDPGSEVTVTVVAGRG